MHMHKQAGTYLAEVGVQFCKSAAKLLHILSQKLIGVGDAVVKVTHLVEREVAVQRDNSINAFTCC